MRNLHSRKQREVDWILVEMNRAINRLDHEGEVIDPSALSPKPEYQKEDDMLHVLAHRQTWSEVSSNLFCYFSCSNTQTHFYKHTQMQQTHAYIVGV